MQNEVGVCIVGSNNDYTTKYVIDNLISKTSCNIRFYITLISNGEQHDSIFKEYENAEVNYKQITSEVKTTLSDLINENLSKVKEDYCVIFPCNALVDINWCEDLLYNVKTLENIGCVGIRPINKKVSLTPILNKDSELKNVWTTGNNVVDGVVMFETKHIKGDIGMYDKWFENTGYEQAEFSLKFAFAGMNNFYIRKQSYIELPFNNDIIFPKTTKEGLQMINDFVKSNINFEEDGI